MRKMGARAVFYSPLTHHHVPGPLAPAYLCPRVLCTFKIPRASDSRTREGPAGAISPLLHVSQIHPPPLPRIKVSLLFVEDLSTHRRESCRLLAYAAQAPAYQAPAWTRSPSPPRTPP